MKAEDYALNGLRKLAINKNYIGAIEDFTEAIRLATDYAEAYYHRGLAKFNLARYSKREDNNPLQNLNDAIEDFTKVIRLKADCADAYFQRGIIYRYKKEHENSIQDFTQAINIDKNYEKAHFYRGFEKEELTKEDNVSRDAISDYKNAFIHTNYKIEEEQIFYRFRPINQHTIESLVNKKLFVADPKTFNDPFDSLLLKCKTSNEYNQLKEFDKNIRIASFASKILKSTKDKSILENILLWSYYAENHTGIAIGYRFNTEKFKSKKAFLKNINYDDIFIKDDWSDIFHEAYLNKFTAWQHEQEWRFVYLKDDVEQDPVLLDLNDWGIEIAEIVFGWKCPDYYRKMIYELFKEANINTIFYAIKDAEKNGYAIEITHYKNQQ